MILKSEEINGKETLVISGKIGSDDKGDICVHRKKHNFCTGCDFCGLDTALQYGADFNQFFYKNDYSFLNIPKGCTILDVTSNTLVLGYEHKNIVLKTFGTCGDNHMYRISCHEEWKQIQEIKDHECEPINVGYVGDAIITSYGSHLQHIGLISQKDYKTIEKEWDFTGSVEDAVQEALEHHDENRKTSWLEETMMRFFSQISHDEFDWEECYGYDL